MELEQHDSLVRRIAFCLHKRLPKGAVDVNDLIQSGWIGLLDASKKYLAEKNACFEAYATLRVRGSMLDYLRQNDWGTRSVRRKKRRVDIATQRVEHTHGAAAKPELIAEELGISLDEYFVIIRDSYQMHVPELDGDDCNSSGTYHINTDALDLFEFLLSDINEQQLEVFHRYYVEGDTLLNIGKHYGVSESRACQIKTSVDNKIRNYFQQACYGA